MGLNLKEYSIPREYPAAYSHNFHAIDGIQEDVLFDALVRDLSRFSGAPYEIVLLDLKDFLMKHEYYPGILKVNFYNGFLLPKYIVSFVKNLTAKRHGIYDVIVDTWFPQATRDFYTVEMQDGLRKEYRCLFTSFNSLTYAKAGYFLKSLVPFALSFFRCFGIARKHKLDLRLYVYQFFKRSIIGLTLKERVKPRLIISGNDNGFAFITAKIAGAELMLIQNGRRSLAGHFAFRYADHYIAMADIYRMVSSGLTNHIFKNIYNFGSISLYRKMNNHNNGNKIIYDLLWVSNLTSMADAPEKSNWSQFYDHESECKAIKIINNFSQKSSLRIAYQCRVDSEIKGLERAGLKSGNISYITPSMQDVYSSLFQSKAVLTPISTVCLEAMGVGKKAGFVNLSGNSFLNLYFKDLGIEFNQESSIPFEAFIEKIMTQELDYKDYFLQNQNYISDLLAVIGKIMEAGKEKTPRIHA